MIPELDPLPWNARPPGWCACNHDDERIAYRRPESGVELIATRIDEDARTAADGCRCWELRVRTPAVDEIATRSIDRVSTREAALSALSTWMARLHDEMDDPADLAALRTVPSSADPIDLDPEPPHPGRDVSAAPVPDATDGRPTSGRSR